MINFQLLNISHILVWIALLGIHSNVDLLQLVLYLNFSVNYSLCTIFMYLEVKSFCQQKTETNTDDNPAWVVWKVKIITVVLTMSVQI